MNVGEAIIEHLSKSISNRTGKLFRTSVSVISEKARWDSFTVLISADPTDPNSKEFSLLVITIDGVDLKIFMPSVLEVHMDSRYKYFHSGSIRSISIELAEDDAIIKTQFFINRVMTIVKRSTDDINFEDLVVEIFREYRKKHKC